MTHLTHKRTVDCSKCGGAYYHKETDEHGRRTWACANCGTVTHRQVRLGKKAKERQALIEELVGE